MSRFMFFNESDYGVRGCRLFQFLHNAVLRLAEGGIQNLRRVAVELHGRDKAKM